MIIDHVKTQKKILDAIDGNGAFKCQAYLVFEDIAFWTGKDGDKEYTQAASYFMEKFGIERKTFIRIKKLLKEKGLIDFEGGYRTATRYSLTEAAKILILSKVED